jgi:hypothetical protein
MIHLMALRTKFSHPGPEIERLKVAIAGELLGSRPGADAEFIVQYRLYKVGQAKELRAFDTNS